MGYRIADDDDVTANDPGASLPVPTGGVAGGLLTWIIRNTSPTVTAYVTKTGQDAASALEVPPGEVRTLADYDWAVAQQAKPELWAASACVCRVTTLAAGY